MGACLLLQEVRDGAKPLAGVLVLPRIAQEKAETRSAGVSEITCAAAGGWCKIKHHWSSVWVHVRSPGEHDGVHARAHRSFATVQSLGSLATANRRLPPSLTHIFP
jgi:hypothetical protein